MAVRPSWNEVRAPVRLRRGGVFRRGATLANRPCPKYFHQGLFRARPPSIKFDVNADGDRVAAASEVHPFNRANVVVIAPPGEQEVPVRRDEIIGGVKIDPA
jgi:hypothetical protein